MNNYFKLKQIQAGRLSLRRFRKRVVILLISFNIWIDEIIIGVLNYTKYTIDSAIHKIESIEKAVYPTWVYDFDIGSTIKEMFDTDNFQVHLIQSKGIIDFLANVLLFLSIFFWIEILFALRFVYADYHVVLADKKKKQCFIIVAIVFNLLFYLLLKQI